MNIFSNLMSPETLYVFLWLLGAFLIGLILGWFIWGRAVRRLKDEVTQLRNKLRLSQTDVDTLKAESILLDKQINGLNKQVGDLNKEVKTKHNRIQDIEIEKGNLHTKNIKLKGSLKAIESEKLSFGSQIKDLNASYNGTKSEAEALELKVAGLEAELNAAANTHIELENKLKALENNAPVMASSLDELELDTNLKSNVSGELKAAQTKIAVLEGMVEGYKEQLADVENDLAECNASKASLHATAIINEEEETEVLEIIVEEEVEPSLETGNNLDTETQPEDTKVTDAKVAVAAALAGSVGLASKDSRDNLTKITGIGKFLAKKLNSLGIYKFAQIANFDDEVIQNVTTAIEFFPGRIERDEWVRQAKELIGEVTKAEVEVVETTEIEEVVEVAETTEIEEVVETTEIEEVVEVAETVEIEEVVEIPEPPKPMSKSLEAIEAADKAKAKAKTKVKAKVEKVEEEKEEEVIVEGAPAVSKVDAEAAKEIVKSKIGSTIPVATAEEKDDLKIISGVGPFIEEKLNDLGLFTYEQISLFDNELINRVTDAIEFFPGRIKRDDWVKQAKDLLKKKKSNIASSALESLIGNRISSASVDDKDNLKKISGVGPFIEEKMNNLGIYTFKQVSEFDEEIIQLVTDAIQFFPGRIVRDEWVRQAGELHKEKS